MSDDPIAPLLLRIAQQDRAAFRALYRAAAPKLLGVLIRMLGQRSEAEDAMQEVFTRIWLKAGRFDPARGRGMAWVMAVARNLAIDRLRARPAESTGDDASAVDLLADERPGVESRLVALGEARRVAECFDTLEPSRAAALRGAYLEGTSYEGLAQRHEVPINTMRTWLRRGLIALRSCLEKGATA